MKKIVFNTLMISYLLAAIAFGQNYGSITGTVYESDTQFLLPNVRISIDSLHISTLSDINGEYKLIKVPVGKHRIKAMNSIDQSLVKTITVKRGRLSKLDFVFTQRSIFGPRYILMGTVTDFNTGLPIADANVFLYGEPKATKTNKKGQFRFLLPKEKSVVSFYVTKGDYYKSMENVVLDPGPITNLSIKIKKSSKLISRTFNLKYRTFNPEFRALLQKEFDLSDKRCNITSKSFHITDTAENLKKLEKIIRKFDVPLKQIWLELRLIYASNDGNGAGKVPDEIKPVAKQLRSLFRFKKYELIDDARLNVEENSRCRFRTGKGYCDVIIENISFSNQDGGLIKLKTISLKKIGERDPMLVTTVNIPDGDTLILGASNADETGKALIAVVTATTRD